MADFMKTFKKDEKEPEKAPMTPQQALEEYGYTEIETGTVLDILTSNDSNEGVDELVTQFIEKIEQEASAKDTAISKGVANEWKSIQSNIQDSQ